MESETACLVPNIGPRGIRRRRSFGVAWVTIAVALAAWMLTTHASLTWLASLALPFTLGAVYLLQARERT